MLEFLRHYYVVFIGIMSVITFVVFGIDKRRAIKKQWRIPEKTLFTLTLCGGFLGEIAGMLAFRHKTKHTSFYVVFFISLILHAGIIGYINSI